MFNKVEILYVGIGAGHKSAALALANAFKLAGTAKEVQAVDALQYTGRMYAHLCRGTHLKMVQKAPHFFGWMYDRLDTPWQGGHCRLFLSRTQSRPFIRFLQESNADLFVCTHFLPAELISWLRGTGKISTPQAIAVIDIDVHAMWLCHHYEHYFVAQDQPRAYLEKLGIPREKITPTGIPIDPAFAIRKDKTEMRLKHGLLPDRTTILLSAGGFGVAPVGDMLSALLDLKHPVQIAAICGRNDKLKAQAEEIAAKVPARHPVLIKPIGYTKEMDEYMSASDIAVGKPGALTMSEALSKGLAFGVVKPIRRQEDRNSHHILQNGAGFRCEDIEVLPWMIDQLLDDPQRLATMQANALRMSKPNAAVEIVRKLSQLLDTSKAA